MKKAQHRTEILGTADKCLTEGKNAQHRRQMLGRAANARQKRKKQRRNVHIIYDQHIPHFFFFFASKHRWPNSQKSHPDEVRGTKVCSVIRCRKKYFSDCNGYRVRDLQTTHHWNASVSRLNVLWMLKKTCFPEHQPSQWHSSTPPSELFWHNDVYETFFNTSLWNGITTNHSWEIQQQYKMFEKKREFSVTPFQQWSCSLHRKQLYVDSTFPNRGTGEGGYIGLKPFYVIRSIASWIRVRVRSCGLYYSQDSVLCCA